MNITQHIPIRYDAWILIPGIINAISITVLLLAIIIDFVMYHKSAAAKKKKHSLIETGSMFGFFLIYMLILTSKEGRVLTRQANFDRAMIILGTLLVTAGCAVNVWGRLILKANWANQVTIYEQHTLVTRGAYRIARHPLYASIIWMLVGGSLVYEHVYALLAVLMVFVPMMVYRAGQEEKLLLNEFPEYTDYKKKVGMFYPKIKKNAKV